jgi:hypothetical protein
MNRKHFALWNLDISGVYGIPLPWYANTKHFAEIVFYRWVISIDKWPPFNSEKNKCMHIWIGPVYLERTRKRTP